jgi:hypothetical protein
MYVHPIPEVFTEVWPISPIREDKEDKVKLKALTTRKRQVLFSMFNLWVLCCRKALPLRRI